MQFPHREHPRLWTKDADQGQDNAQRRRKEFNGDVSHSAARRQPAAKLVEKLVATTYC